MHAKNCVIAASPGISHNSTTMHNSKSSTPLSSKDIHKYHNSNHGAGQSFYYSRSQKMTLYMTLPKRSRFPSRIFAPSVVKIEWLPLHGLASYNCSSYGDVDIALRGLLSRLLKKKKSWTAASNNATLCLGKVWLFNMSSEVDMRRNVVKRSSLDEPNRIHPNLTQDTTANGSFTSPLGKPYPFFVPSSVKSTLGSPVRLRIYVFVKEKDSQKQSCIWVWCNGGLWRLPMLTSGISSLVCSAPSPLRTWSNKISAAGVGMVISAQWELILGNSFGYTILSDFGKLPFPPACSFQEF